MRKVFLIFVAAFIFSETSVFAWGDLCQDAKDTPSMTRVQIDEFFKSSLLGNSYSGKGVVRDVRPYGGNQYVVVVDCLNDVVANVILSSSSAKDLKTGQEVSFSGRCTRTFRKAFRDTHRTYQAFELDGGDIR